MMPPPTPARHDEQHRAEENEEAFTGRFSKKTPPKKTTFSI